MITQFLDEICEAIFEVKPFYFIPSVYKIQVNYIVFCAVTNHFHIKLLKLYHEKYQNDNKIASRFVQNPFPSTGNPDILSNASNFLTKFHLMTSVAEGISMIESFVKMVISSLPSKNPAADEILPAVCDGISRCIPLASHIVSTFTYLSDVWPEYGLEEKIGYEITTCAIAASHFVSPCTLR